MRLALLIVTQYYIKCNKMKIYKKLCISASLCLAMLLGAGCTADETVDTVPLQGTLQFTTSVERFAGEPVTRTNIVGNAFETGDKIKIKMICPFSERVELGESTYSGSFDGFYLLKWHADSEMWLTLTAGDGYDINGDYSPSASPDIYSMYLAQPTPYVFTAQTWSEEQIFIAGDGTRVEQYSNVFHADQSREVDYKASDLMWAQTIMQTGSYNVHLSFKHVMAALKITVEGDISENAVLTLEGMPDIDQCEVIVGDYYAEKSQVNSNNFGYKGKHRCTPAESGKVIGVAEVTANGASCVPISSRETTTYTALRVGNKFRLIVPPSTLNQSATIWLRDGAKRYSMALSQTTFEAGKLYNVTFNIKKDENQ